MHIVKGRRFLAVALLTILGFSMLIPVLTPGEDTRVIEVIADKDNKFKVPGQKQPVITLKANEVVTFRITSRKGPDWEKDGAVHSFTITALKDRGWNHRLKEGTQELKLVAPEKPGKYIIECTVKCGDGHDYMRMKLIVTP